MANIINNTQKANEIRIPTNGNCKAVRNITEDKRYGSMTEAAMEIGVSFQAIHYAVKNKSLCKGRRLILESELHQSYDDVCAESAKANRRAEKAEARLVKVKAKEEKNKSEMAELRAKAELWDAYMAEQEAKRKEEAKRLEAERKAKEAEERKIAKAQREVERLTNKLNRHNDTGRTLEQQLMKAEMELEALLDARKEVV